MRLRGGLVSALGIATGVLYGASVLLVLWMPASSPLPLALVTSALTLGAMVKTAQIDPDWAVASNRGLGILIQLAAPFAVIVFRKHELQRRALYERAEVANLELGRLEGLLPICAWCKRIRDEAGVWQQLEVYIQERSEAEFSHGACPACAERILAGVRGNR